MRYHYLDNIRWVTVLLVMFFHVFYYFNAYCMGSGIGGFSDYQSQDAVLYLLYPWLMPLLFVVAGMSSRYALQRKSAGEYLRAARPRRAFGAAGASGYRTRELPSETEVTDEDERLFQRLRGVRKQLADEFHVPPYMVFSDATLRAMVRRRPTTAEELLSVSGVGKTKLERYGAVFLSEINR